MMASAAPGSADNGVFRCPGTDPAFFQEIDESGWVGYGETWDMHTCGEGRAVYLPGATRRWLDLRPKISELFRRDMHVDAEFYSTILPWGLFGSFFGVFGFAWLLAVRHRRKKVIVLSVDCPVCAVGFPVIAGTAGTQSHFCPNCGGSSAVFGQTESGEISAHARIL